MCRQDYKKTPLPVWEEAGCVQATLQTVFEKSSAINIFKHSKILRGEISPKIADIS